jgi:hypothetical protein
MAVTRALAAALLAVAACWQPILHPQPGSSGLVAVAAVVLAGLAVALLAHGARIPAVVTPGPLRGRASALRAKSLGAVFQRQLNPDAAGHIRPRAPGAVPAAA